MISWTTLTNARRIGHRLLSATLRCRQCSRPAGEVVGYADCSLAEAHFLPVDACYLPHYLDGQLRCGRCAGQLHLDDIEPLGRTVLLEEVGGVPFARAMAGDRELPETPAA